jgi:hypothetical protein
MHPPPDPQPQGNVRATLLAGAISVALCATVAAVILALALVGILAETAL